LLAKIAVARRHRTVDSGAREVLTFEGRKAYILVNSARRRLGATARLRSSSLIFGDKASDRGRGPSGFDGLPAIGRWDRHGSGLFDR
jgi:hypothetical protein